MFGKEYECRDCGRAFLVEDDKKREPKCPSCAGENVARKQPRPLPPWIVAMNKTGSN